MSIHIQLPFETVKKRQAQQKRSQILSVIISFLTVVLIAAILSVFALPMLYIETSPIVTYASSLEIEQEVQQKKMSQSPSRNPSAPAQNMARVIAANTAAPTAIPVPDIAVTEPSLEFGDDNDFGAGWSDEGTGTSGSIFGKKLTSRNLGVILDVSASAHKHLDKAFAEIDKNFPSAYIILVVGCGMSDGKGSIKGGNGKVPGKPRIVAYKDIDSEKKYNSLPRSVPAQLEGFFKKTGAKRSEELRKYFKERNNLYALYGGDILATNFAFDLLLDSNVDTIYWFADFADRTDAETIEELTKKLRRSRVTVISHNFLGKPVGELAAEMTKKTGGQTIEVIPGK